MSVRQKCPITFFQIYPGQDPWYFLLLGSVKSLGSFPASKRSELDCMIVSSKIEFCYIDDDDGQIQPSS